MEGGERNAHYTTLGDSNPKVLRGWAFRDVTVSGAREASADVLTTTEVQVLCGAWGTECRTQVLALAW